MLVVWKTVIDPARIRVLSDRGPASGDHVLYWMQQSQRVRFNHALEHAVRWANDLRVPVVVAFGLMETYPEANARHFAFMLQGLQEVRDELAGRGIAFFVQRGAPDDVASRLVGRARVVVCDRGYLRHQRGWRQEVAERAACRVEQIEADAVVPVEEASDHREYAARTLRPRLHRALGEYEHGLAETEVHCDAGGLRLPDGLLLQDVEGIVERLEVDHSVPPVRRFRGGTSVARRHLATFLRHRLPGYASERNEPINERVSYLSPYLHFGQISPIEVLLKARDSSSPSDEDRASFIEELVVRRELAINFVHYEPHYDRYRCLPDWARKTLREHREDPRPHHYTRAQLEAARTHDPYWNAAMREMVHTGYMHNYMRMYWGKKILEWTNTPEHAYQTTLSLNNKYFLDGRDPNSYANVAWIFGLHDRAWAEREVLGKIRYMSAEGLERKFDMQAYVDWVEELVAREQGG